MLEEWMTSLLEKLPQGAMKALNLAAMDPDTGEVPNLSWRMGWRPLLVVEGRVWHSV